MSRVSPSATSLHAHGRAHDASDPDRAAPSGADLAEALFATVHALKQYGKVCIECSPLEHRLSMPRAHLLAEVAEAGSVRMGDLSQRLCVTARNVTALVDGLEREGLIARRPDPADRRAILLDLTYEGQAYIADIHNLQASIGEKMFAPLTTDERCHLFELLRRLVHGARSAASAPPDAGSWPQERRDPWERKNRDASSA
ncbi:MAG TPA: MarR family transcriptional regulator [Ktedonobacterales bacterium]|nr:MarR family transcriptional regulator [Ktedonobacterales bacterium]